MNQFPMTKMFGALFFVLAAVQTMQAAPAPGPLLPFISEADTNLGTASA